MNSNKKTIIQALAVPIFALLIYYNWQDFTAKIACFELLCLFEIIVQIVYILFNKKKLNKENIEKEGIIIVIYLIAMLGIYLLSLIIKH